MHGPQLGGLTVGCGVYMKMPLAFIRPPRWGREGWGWFSSFVVPHSGMGVRASVHPEMAIFTDFGVALKF